MNRWSKRGFRGNVTYRAASLAICGLLLIALPLPVFSGKIPNSASQAVSNPPWLFAVAVKLHMKAVEGDRQAARDSRRMFEDLVAADPADHEVAAYLGSSYLLAASMALTPWGKWTYAKKGLRLLDGAVETAPADPRMRFLRGISARGLPGWFGRGSQADADIAAVASTARRDFLADRLTGEMAAYALYLEGLARNRRGDAEGAGRMWTEALALGVVNTHTKNAERQLARLNEGRKREKAPARFPQARPAGAS